MYPYLYKGEMIKMFGISYPSGNIRPNNWYGILTIKDFIKRNDSLVCAVPKDYINNLETKESE